MRFTLAACLAITLLYSAPAHATKPQLTPPVEDAKHRTYLQNYKDMLLAACIGRVYSAYPEVKRDTDASASGYAEFGSFDAEGDVDTRRSIVETYASRSYASITRPDGKAMDGGAPIQLGFMKCMDMYHSTGLDLLARKSVDKPNRSFAEDNPDFK